MEHAELSCGDLKISLPVIEGTEGERALDIAKLRASTGLITLDNGFVNTGSCESKITFIDGEAGILRYRGYPIEEISEQTDFLEAAYLVMFGTLPSQEEYEAFRGQVIERQHINPDIHRLIGAFPPKSHPMSSLISSACSLAAFYPYDPDSRAEIDDAILSYLGRLPVLAAAGYRIRKGLKPVAADPSLSYAGNVLHMMFAGEEPYLDGIDPEIARALDVLLILHVDHEQNCSTASMRMVSSSQVNLYAAGSGAMSALWGPLHGGANQAVIEMLTRIAEDGGNVEKYIELAKNKESNFRLMGFGHRVYKNFDPRATIIKKHARSVLSKLNINDPLLLIARRLEEAALADDYFIDRKLFPNVDFYSGIIYKAMGIPTDMFTVLFALGRLPGWIAHWRELMADAKLRIGRPRQVYQGPTLRKLESKVHKHL